jgi:DNA-binding MarR family transcriptional regulator
MATHNSNSIKEMCKIAAVNCMGMQVRRAARLVSAHYDTWLKPVGLKGTQFTLLNAVILNPRISIGRLSEKLLMDRTTLNRNLKPLERRGLIRNEPGEDLRMRNLVVTRKGEKTLHEAIPLWKVAQTDVEKLMGNRLKGLTNGLRKLEGLNK